MQPVRIWYVVLNTTRARILRSLPGPNDRIPVEVTIQGRSLNLGGAIEERSQTAPATGGGNGRFADGGEPESLQKEARTFVREVLSYLEQQRDADGFDELVVICPSEIISLWQAEISGDLQGTVRREFNKSLVRFSSRELAAAIRALQSSCTAR
ncbi:host attachment protein [Roseovarius sp. S4756]|uniref:host attachment protein n=1 Tax=Roseovarius maritimus TaxID=3342637 RepID=UPI00372A308B